MDTSAKTGRARDHRLIPLAAGALCGFGCWNSAIAVPPQKLPQEPPPTAAHPGAGAPAANPFPSAIHRRETVKTDNGIQDLGADRGADDRMTSAGAGALKFQEASKARALAQRIQNMHREGLPIAHLWESHSSALSIGLNERGKPGIWFTQKVQ